MRLGVSFFNPKEKAGIVALLGRGDNPTEPNLCQSESATQVEFRIL